MPPQNNLKQHLKWLLTATPFVPPSVPLVTYDPTDNFNLDALSNDLSLSQHVAVDNETASAGRPTTAPVPAVPCPSLDRPLARTKTIDIHKPPELEEAESDMARLRATPSNGKPRLALVGMPPNASTPSTGRQRQEEDNARSRAAQNGRSESTWLTREESPSGAEPLNLRKPHVQVFNVEAIDLTNDDESPSSPKLDGFHKGKKRKSDEYREDLGRELSPRPARRAPTRSPDLMTDDFPDIDDFVPAPKVPVPASPPPPYSTVALSKGHTRQGEALADQDSWSSEEEAPVATSRKRKSLSRAPSETSIPARKIGRQARSPSPLKKDIHVESVRTPTTKRVGHAVMDSEEEEDFGDDLDVMELDLLPKSSPTKRTRKQISKSPVKPSTQLQLPVRSPSKRSRSRTPHDDKQCSIPTPETTQSSRKEEASPKKSQIKTLVQPVLSSSELSREQKTKIHGAIEFFLASDGEKHLQSVTVAWEKAKAAFVEQVELDDPDPHVKENLERLRPKKAAVEQLITLKANYDKTVTERDVLKKKVQDDIEEGIYDDADYSALRTVSKSLEDIEVQIHHYLDIAGVQAPKTVAREPRKPAIKVEARPHHVVVEATQASPARRKLRTIESDASHVPQTQFPNTCVWSPTHGVRFADHQVSASSAPKLSMKAQKEAHPDYATGDGFAGGRLYNTVENFDEYDFSGSENIFTENMGTVTGGPTGRMGVNDDDEDEFGMDDDEDLLHEMGNMSKKDQGHFDWRGDRANAAKPVQQRAALHETTLNTVQRHAKPHSPHKSTTSMPAKGVLGMTHPWSKDVKAALLHKFHLRGFRPGQLEAINATLAGEHCFVLMPTGGGKSLCYQLPSVIRSGKTHGVSIVVSPLLSLMEDQVESAMTRFQVQACLINGQTPANEKAEIMEKLEQREDPGKFIQLLYVTPEMLSKNQRMISAFQTLHNRGHLARIIIDEAHCVSQWGHDFRPDYKALGDVVRQFPGVPIMALTATATTLVRADVRSNLGIENGRMFSQSFNRPNLSYEVLPKVKGMVNVFAELINKRYKGKSGIIYCLSRKNCEDVAKKLTELGVKAFHYHAGMGAEERSDVQRKWQRNQYHVIVATIAFGMGIDKADVRYVIHHSIPKSLEGYYQETGRAGRDGKRSECYLYYQYGDTRVLHKMIDEGDGSMEQKQRLRDMLRTVVQYCENKADCRRAQVLGYFSEPFDPANCNKTCDNCRSDTAFVTKDLTDYAAMAFKLVSKVHEDNVTMHQCVDAFRGAKGAKIKKGGLEEFGWGYGADLDRGDNERIFQSLLESRSLKEKSVVNKVGFATNYLHPATSRNDYETKRKQLQLQVRASPMKGPVRKKQTKKQPDYPSTNVSSPIRATKRRIQDYAYQQQHSDSDDEHFEKPQRGIRNQKGRSRNAMVIDSEFSRVRDAKPSGAAAQPRGLGKPITVDERISRLSRTHQAVLHDFLEGAKGLRRDIMVNNGHRTAIFSDTVLQEIGLRVPSDMAALKAIPGINPEMVDRYGKKFMLLINNTRELYGEIAAAAQDSEPQYPPDIEELSDGNCEDEDDERVNDPNHQNVIDLSKDSDDEDAPIPVDDSESNYSYGGSSDEEDTRRSHHFTQPVDSDVEEFNSRLTQAHHANAAASRANATASKRAPRAASSGPKKKFPRRTSGGFYGRGGFQGVKKRSSSKATGNAPKRGAGGSGSSRRGGAGGGGAGGGWGGIMSMPT